MKIQLVVSKRSTRGYKAELKFDGKRKGTLYPQNEKEIDLLHAIFEDGVSMVRNKLNYETLDELVDLEFECLEG